MGEADDAASSSRKIREQFVPRSVLDRPHLLRLVPLWMELELRFAIVDRQDGLKRSHLLQALPKQIDARQI